MKDDAGNDLRSNGQESYLSALATLCFVALFLLEGNYSADLNGIAKVLWYVFIFPDAGYDVVKGLMRYWTCCLVDFSWDPVLSGSLSCAYLVDGLLYFVYRKGRYKTSWMGC